MTVEMILFCHNFQHRMSWLLSAIKDQVGDIPEMIFNVAALENNGSPYTTEEILKYYSNFFQCIHSKTTKDELRFPSILKNRLIESSRSDYLMFWSADTLMHPEYFSILKKKLCALTKVHCCIGSKAKCHTDVKATDELIKGQMYVSDAYKKALDIKMRDDGKVDRVGGHLIVRRADILKKNDGLYVKPENCRDRDLFRKGMKTRSDIGFRANMGGTKTIKLPLLIHLNHARDKEERCHLEVQR